MISKMKMNKLQKYKPIKIHHILYSYGWWFGSTFFFFKRGLVIVPVYAECKNAIYASNGEIIGHGDTHSWSESRQKENKQ